MSENCDNITSGFFKSILAIPTSPLARPLPSTTATITDAAVWVETADEDVTVKQLHIFGYKPLLYVHRIILWHLKWNMYLYSHIMEIPFNLTNFIKN